MPLRRSKRRAASAGSSRPLPAPGSPPPREAFEAVEEAGGFGWVFEADLGAEFLHLAAGDVDRDRLEAFSEGFAHPDLLPPVRRPGPSLPVGQGRPPVAGTTPASL